MVINVGAEDISEEESEIVAVDNASDNRGYGWACNRGIEQVSGDFVLVSNSDVQYLPGSVDAMFRAAHQGSVLVGPVHIRTYASLTPASDSLQPDISVRASRMRWLRVGAAQFSAKRRAFLLAAGADFVPLPDRFTLSGASLLASRATWTEIGGFDEDFFLYQEDAELSVRARGRNVFVGVAPAARIVHCSGTNRRGLSAFAVGLAMTSERVAWRKMGLRPFPVLVLLQVGGASIRLAGSTFRCQRSSALAWCHVLLRGYWIRDLDPRTKAIG